MKTPEEWLASEFCKREGPNIGSFTVYGIEAIQEDARIVVGKCDGCGNECTPLSIQDNGVMLCRGCLESGSIESSMVWSARNERFLVDVLSIRCSKHYSVPQQNKAEHSGAECGGCIAEQRDEYKAQRDAFKSVIDEALDILLPPPRTSSENVLDAARRAHAVIHALTQSLEVILRRYRIEASDYYTAEAAIKAAKE